MATETPTQVDVASIRSRRASEQRDQCSCSQLQGGDGCSTARAPHAAPVTDRSRQFVTAAQNRINGTLLKCEERYPARGHHSLLYVVVQNGGSQVESLLSRVHEEFFGPDQEDPLAPVRLLVVDQATDTALQRLVESGLTQSSARASRILWPAEKAESHAAPLSPAEVQKATTHRRQSAHKLKVARVLADAGLALDARSPLLEALLSLARALAVENRLPEPEVVYESLLPPFAGAWGQHLTLFRNFATDPEEDCRPALETLSRLI